MDAGSPGSKSPPGHTVMADHWEQLDVLWLPRVPQGSCGLGYNLSDLDPIQHLPVKTLTPLINLSSV